MIKSLSVAHFLLSYVLFSFQKFLVTKKHSIDHDFHLDYVKKKKNTKILGFCLCIVYVVGFLQSQYKFALADGEVEKLKAKVIKHNKKFIVLCSCFK